jgi:hypothetical protein
MSGTIKKGSISFSSPISRRVVLRGAGGGLLSLPLFNDLVARKARAQSAPFPKRLVVIFTPNGTIAEGFWGSNSATGTNWTPGSIFTPLMAHKNDIIVMDGIDMSAAQEAGNGDAHGLGMGCMLTGKKLQSGEMFKAGMGGPGSGWADNESIDQLIARTVGTMTKFTSIELAGKRYAGNIWSRMSYKGPATPVAPEDEPQRAWDRLFMGLGGTGQPPPDNAAAMRLNARRKSVLDNVTAELKALGPKLGMSDRMKLQQHEATIAALQQRLTMMPTTMTPTMPTSACAPPTRPSMLMQLGDVRANESGMQTINASIDKNFPDIISAHLDITALALACDVTRVASIIVAPSRSDVVMQWSPLNYTEAHHQVSHFGDAEKDSKNKLIKMNQWYAEQIAKFVTKLKSIPEGTGSVFTNTVILWVNELGVGNSHTHTRIPFALIGSAGGYFKTNKFVKYNRVPHNRLLLSVAQAMGVNVTQFGDPKYCTAGALPDLTT